MHVIADCSQLRSKQCVRHNKRYIYVRIDSRGSRAGSMDAFRGEECLSGVGLLSSPHITLRTDVRC